jgi:hypothetical protein
MTHFDLIARLAFADISANWRFGYFIISKKTATVNLRQRTTQEGLLVPCEFGCGVCRLLEVRSNPEKIGK